MPTSDSKKILYIITKSNFGGAQKYLFELAVAASKNHEVTVACGGTGEKNAALGELADKLKANNIKVIPVNNFLRDMSVISDLKAVWEIWRLIHKLKPDVVHSTSSKAGGIASFAARLNFTPRIVFTSHGLSMDENWRPNWQVLLIKFSTWLTLMLTHKSIMISTENFIRTSKMWGLSKKVTLIHNGISPVEFLDTAVARTKLFPAADHGILWVGGIGELHPNKNWSAAILAMKELPKNIHLFIISDGEQKENLEKLTAENNLSESVHLLGRIDNAKAYLKAFDIFMLPSLKEGLPYVLLEAGLAKRPTIASNLPGNQDIITDQESGLLIEPTPSNITNAIKTLAEDTGFANLLANQLHTSTHNKFSLDKMISQTIKIYDSKIGSPS